MRSIPDIIQQIRQFFATGKTTDLAFRIENLKKLKQVLLSDQTAIYEALYQDLHKPKFEVYTSEINLLVTDINHIVKHLKSWVKPTKVSTPLAHITAKAEIRAEPLGVVLIIGAWNYPIQLTIGPVIGAIAAGNCAILKPSESTPRTSNLINQIISKTFEPNYITVVEGDVTVGKALLEQKFDLIFFTGSTAIGKIIMEQAAKTLTPVVLELGGKCPAIVDYNIPLEYTARRLVWGKFMNAGQTCVAPDYLLVDHRIKQPLILELIKSISTFYSSDPQTSPDYSRIINQKQLSRLLGLLSNCEIITGGQSDTNDLYLAPTLVEGIDDHHPLMAEEIFGPILPIFTYQTLEEAIAIVNSRPKPLALYFFSLDQSKYPLILQGTSSGGVCLNDTVIHCDINSLPFGGVGASGMGQYHGKASFDCFTHYKSIVYQSTKLDIPFRYPPYKNKLDWLKKFL